MNNLTMPEIAENFLLDKTCNTCNCICPQEIQGTCKYWIEIGPIEKSIREENAYRKTGPDSSGQYI